MSEAPEAPEGDVPSEAARPSVFARTLTWLKRYGRWLLLIFGVLTVGALVHHVGPANVWRILVLAAPWLPLILALEASLVGVESLGLLAFFGRDARRIPIPVFARTMMVYYVTMIVLPVGRAGAEVTRAAILAPYVGAQRATAAAVQNQSMVWVANAMISIVCLAAIVPITGFRGLALLTVGNAAATAVMGIGMYLFIRRVRIGGWLARRFQKMSKWGPELDEAARQGPRTPLLPLLFCFGGRMLQVVQYGFLLLAVGGTLSVSSALIAESIHLVGAGLGDVVPNQVGVTESAYQVFAGALGLAETPEKALGIALLARVANFSIAGLCFLGMTIWKAPPPPAE